MSDAPTADSPDSSAPVATSSVDPAAKRRRRRERRYCLSGILAGLIGIGLGRLADLWVHFNLFAQFTAQFWFLVLACFIAVFLPRGRTVLAMALFLACIIGLGIWPHAVSAIPVTPPAAASGEKALRLMQFNTLIGNDDNDAIAAEIERQDADIVTLLEVGPARRPIFDRLRARWPHQRDCLDKPYCHVAILSKLPIVASEARVMWRGPPYLLVKLGPEAGNLTVIGVHTIRFPYQRAQFTQIAAMMRELQSIPGNRALMGDFNTTPFSFMLRNVEMRSGLTRLTRLPTWPSHLGLPQIAIDHIFVSPGVRLIEPQRIGRNAGSDHYPVILSVAVPLN